MAFSPRINTLLNGLVFFLVITCKEGSQCVLLIGDGTLRLSIFISLLLHAIMPMSGSIPIRAQQYRQSELECLDQFRLGTLPITRTEGSKPELWPAICSCGDCDAVALSQRIVPLFPNSWCNTAMKMLSRATWPSAWYLLHVACNIFKAMQRYHAESLVVHALWRFG